MQKRTIQVLSIWFLIALLLWGGYTLIVYLGVPVHGAILLSDEVKRGLVPHHCTDAYFTCGVLSLLPFISFTFQRAIPLFGFAVLSVLLYALMVSLNFIRTGQWSILRVRIRPVAFFLLFLFFVWLIFTFLSVSEVDRISMRQIAEPSPLVYASASPSVLRALEENFHQLDQRGCLALIGEYENGAKVYDMSVRCMQEAFFTRVVPPFLFLLGVLFEFLVAGRMILRLFRTRPIPPFPEAMVSVGLGACAWIVILWLLAIFHIIVTGVTWVIVILLPIVGYRQSLYWLKRFFRAGEEQEMGWYSPAILLAWALLFYLAFNYLTVVRPFPIGWDDLGSYLNRPRLMVSYGSFIFSMAPFQWEYLTSLGFLLFGYGSTFGATASMMVNWLAGALATGAVLAFGQVFLGKGRGLLAALLYYTLPVVGHFSFADMKIDNAVFTMGALAFLALFLALFTMADGEEGFPFHDRLKWIALSGIFLGFGFAMKPTVVMVFMALSAILLGASLHWVGFIGVVSFAVAMFVKRGVLDVTDVLRRIGHLSSLSPFAVLVGAIIFGCVLLIVAGILRPLNIRRTILSSLVFGAAFLGSVAPWLYRNSLLAGQIVPHSLELGAPNPFNPLFDLDGSIGKGTGRPYRALSPDTRVDRKSPACKATGGREELDRYWGNSVGWQHYLTLPWRTVMNLDAIGYYVTTSPALFLFPLLLLLPFFWMSRGRWLRWLFAGTAFILLEWMFLASGIPWYGIGIFLGLVVGLEALIARSPDILSRSVAGILIVLALFTAFSQRFWQYEIQRNLLEYPFGKITAEALQERTVPHYGKIGGILEQRKQAMPDRPYVYRVGTFIPYFIPRNLEIIGISDHQLDFFNCLFAERDPVLTLHRLKELGFNSIIFDTNTATIERDPSGSLHQKVNAFLEFVNTPSLGLTSSVNDPDGGIAFILLP